MANIVVPSIAAMAPTPRVYAPQSNTLTSAVSAASDAITDVAKNWRTKEQSVTKANAVADYLEKEGMTSEAAAYRSAAQNYQTNFFATPAENEKFNQSMIGDTIKLLSDKQARDIKRAELAEQRSYHQGMVLTRGMSAQARAEAGDDGLDTKKLNATRLAVGTEVDDLREANKEMRKEMAELEARDNPETKEADAARFAELDKQVQMNQQRMIDAQHDVNTMVAEGAGRTPPKRRQLPLAPRQFTPGAKKIQEEIDLEDADDLLANTDQPYVYVNGKRYARSKQTNRAVRVGSTRRVDQATGDVETTYDYAVPNTEGGSGIDTTNPLRKNKNPGVGGTWD